MIRKFSIVLASLIGLTGCGAPAAPTGVPTAAPAQAPTAAPSPAPVMFPVTLTHKYGSTEIKAEPKRIVTVGLVEQDALLALGITPIGTTEWFGKHPGAIWPWAKNKLTGEPPVVLGDATGVNFEKIAAVKPDLILALYSGVTAEQYATLSQIAPTVAQPEAYVDYGVPWQELTLTVGKAVGKQAEAQKLIDDVEAAFANARKQHPQFAGATAVVATPYEGVWLYSAQDSRGRLLTSLGFKLPDGLEAVTGKEFGGNLSLEKVDMLDVDVIVWIDPREAKGPLGGPLYEKLPVHTEGREVFLESYTEDAIGGATSFVTVLSLPYLLERLTPRMAAAIDGDPATVVEGVTPLTAVAASAFPIKIAHKFGEIEIPAEPKRVIALGYSEVDPILALGVKPLALREWFGDQPNGVWPWSQPALGGDKPELLKMPFGELNFEQLAALKPDLIVATHSGITDKEYEKLAQIAPTLAQPADYPDFGVPWQAQTELIGRALGREAQAKALVAEVERLITAAGKDNPQLAGKTVAWASPAEEAGKFWVTGPSTPPLRFLSALGLVYPMALSDLAGDQSAVQLSTERLDLLDVDVLISYVSTEEAKTALQANPVLQSLKVAKEGRWIIFVGGDPVYGALSYSTAPSLRYAVEKLTPRLAAVVSGSAADSATGTQPANAQRDIVDASGATVRVPVEPKRIVVLTEIELDSALALGVTPVGSVNGRGQAGLPAYLADKSVEIVSVGSLAEPSLEKIVALKPDMILAGSMIEQIKALAPDLQKIAPLVVTYKPADDWKTAFKRIADVLNKSAQAEAFLADYDSRVMTLRAGLTSSGAIEANVVRWMPQGPVLMMPATFSSLILADLGMRRPAEVEKLAGGHGAHTDPLSLESLDIIDGDWLFLGSLNADGSAAYKTAAQNTLFKKLKVVQNKRVIEVDGAVWTSIGGPLAALVVLVDVEQAVIAR